ncbi:MAG: CaiB/BaiF CoA-transferase family protein [Desulfosalsimonadaceae bacterium]
MAKTSALSGITVLDISRLLPGPYASMILADHGARVICMEDKRFAAEAFEDNMIYRGKEHMSLNLKSENGKKIFFQLAQSADVILEGFRPGVTARLGVDYERVKSVNPQIIYCSISGYGQTGPYSSFAGHDINYLSVAGVLDGIGETGGRPLTPGVQIADMAGGSMNAVIGIMLALFSRQRTGEGQYIDISMTDGSLSLLSFGLTIQQATGIPLQRSNWLLSHRYASYNTYETSDGCYLSIGALENRFWKNLCEYFGVPEYIPLQYDEDRREEMLEFFRRQFKSQTLEHWKTVLAEREICWAPVQTPSEALEDPLFAQREMVLELSGKDGRSMTALGAPVKLSKTPARVEGMPSEFGADTRGILKELGYSETAIDSLVQEGSV